MSATWNATLQRGFFVRRAGGGCNFVMQLSMANSTAVSMCAAGDIRVGWDTLIFSCLASNTYTTPRTHWTGRSRYGAPRNVSIEYTVPGTDGALVDIRCILSVGSLLPCDCWDCTHL